MAAVAGEVEAVTRMPSAGVSFGTPKDILPSSRTMKGIQFESVTFVFGVANSRNTFESRISAPVVTASELRREFDSRPAVLSDSTGIR
jgi:hypothetical protein